MDFVALALGALVGLAVGLGLGFAARSQWANQSIKAAHREGRPHREPTPAHSRRT